MKAALFGLGFTLGLVVAIAGAWAENNDGAAYAIRLYDSQPAMRASIETTLRYLEGGMGWANAELDTVRHEKALYCPPGKLALMGAQLVDITRRFLTTHPGFGDYPLPMIMLKGLEETFPCN